MLTSLSISPTLCLTVASRSVKLPNSFKPKVLECGRLIQSNNFSKIFCQFLVGRIKGRKSTFELKSWGGGGHLRGSWCGHNPQSGGSFRWERRGSGIQGGGHIGRHGGGNFGTETQIRVQIDRGGNTYKKGFTKSETHRVTIVDKESICKISGNKK